MKKPLLLFLLSIICFHLGAKETVLTISKYDSRLNTYNKTTDTIENTENPSVWYLVNRYNFSFQSPDQYAQPNLKDTIVTIWNNNQGERTFIKNWTHSVKYDSLARVVRFSYSSCMNCGQIPYTQEILYNDAGQITKVNTYINDIIKQENFNRTMPIRHLEVLYDQNHKLEKLMVFESNKLLQSIEINSSI